MAIIGTDLNSRLMTMSGEDTVEVVVFVADDDEEDAEHLSASLDSPQPSRAEVLSYLQAQAEARQADLLGFLQGDVAAQGGAADEALGPQARVIERFWINNSIRMEANAAMISRLADRDDVTHIEMVRRAYLDDLLDNNQLLGALPVPHKPDSTEEDAPKPTWSVKQINAPKVWALGHKGEGVLVAVIDTGVNYKHPDLIDRMWESGEYPNHGYDFSGGGDDDPMDHHGHGSKVAGIVAGDGTSGKSTGVAPEAKILAIRIGETETAIWNCLEFAIAQQVDVISMSVTWKGHQNPDYPGWRRTCKRIERCGIAHANSSGNQGNESYAYRIPGNIGAPGNCPPPWLHRDLPQKGGTCSPMTCGSSDQSDQLRGSSGRGPVAWESDEYDDYPYEDGEKPGLIKPDICAPGSSTDTCGHRYFEGGSAASPYISFNGTSAATPHVAGCMALLISVARAAGTSIRPAQLQEAIEMSAVRMPGQSQSKENHYGAGRIDVLGAYRYGAAQGWWPTETQNIS
ncbi:S8 family serine peptidase [Roseovarius sp. M141]|uniref:S8 family peptidase n=1 Tax=Roseovarius sp. M141 TaxID=2583806 RepID=UPI0020CCF63C|nr:S8 family serine peptidase [Roseovarius sp. M141]MCQ0093387.1 hypothetical protein [Roseovarius sp. M141]